MSKTRTSKRKPKKSCERSGFSKDFSPLIDAEPTFDHLGEVEGSPQRLAGQMLNSHASVGGAKFASEEQEKPETAIKVRRAAQRHRKLKPAKEVAVDPLASQQANPESRTKKKAGQQAQFIPTWSSGGGSHLTEVQQQEQANIAQLNLKVFISTMSKQKHQLVLNQQTQQHQSSEGVAKRRSNKQPELRRKQSALSPEPAQKAKSGKNAAVGRATQEANAPASSTSLMGNKNLTSRYFNPGQQDCRVAATPTRLVRDQDLTVDNLGEQRVFLAKSPTADYQHSSTVQFGVNSKLKSEPPVNSNPVMHSNLDKVSVPANNDASISPLKHSKGKSKRKKKPTERSMPEIPMLSQQIPAAVNTVQSAQVAGDIYWKCHTEEKYSRNQQAKNPISQPCKSKEPALIKMDSQRVLKDSQRVIRGAILAQQRQMVPRMGGDADLNSLRIRSFPSHRSAESMTPVTAGIRIQAKVEQIERILVPSVKADYLDRDANQRVGGATGQIRRGSAMRSTVDNLAEAMQAPNAVQGMQLSRSSSSVSQDERFQQSTPEKFKQTQSTSGVIKGSNHLKRVKSAAYSKNLTVRVQREHTPIYIHNQQDIQPLTAKRLADWKVDTAVSPVATDCGDYTSKDQRLVGELFDLSFRPNTAGASKALMLNAQLQGGGSKGSLFACPQYRAIGLTSRPQPEGIRLEGSAYPIQAQVASSNRLAQHSQPLLNQTPHDGGDYNSSSALQSQRAVTVAQLPTGSMTASPFTMDKRLKMLRAKNRMTSQPSSRFQQNKGATKRQQHSTHIPQSGNSNQGPTVCAPSIAEDKELPPSILPQKEPFMAYLENFIKHRPEHLAPQILQSPSQPEHKQQVARQATEASLKVREHELATPSATVVLSHSTTILTDPVRQPAVRSQNAAAYKAALTAVNPQRASQSGQNMFPEQHRPPFNPHSTVHQGSQHHPPAGEVQAKRISSKTAPIKEGNRLNKPTVDHPSRLANAHNQGAINGAVDDAQSLACIKGLVRSATARTDDLHTLRQHIDMKQRKIRLQNHEMFEEIRSREIQRINAENAFIGKLATYRTTDDKMVRTQLLKGCKRVFRLFWNQFEDEEEAQDLPQMQLYWRNYLASELHLLEVMQEPLEREKELAPKQPDKVMVFKKNHAIRAKLFDACAKEKELDVYFCMSLGVQHARKTLLREINRAVTVYLEACSELNSQGIQQIKRQVKSLNDVTAQRKLKAVSANATTQKMLDYLKSLNQEVRGRRGAYQDEQTPGATPDLPPQSPLPRNLTNLQQAQAHNQSQQSFSRSRLVPNRAVAQQKPFLSPARADDSSPSYKPSKHKPLFSSTQQSSKFTSHPSILMNAPGHTSAFGSSRPMVAHISLRKYQWQFLYKKERKENGIGLRKSFALQKKVHHSLKSLQERISNIYQDDLRKVDSDFSPYNQAKTNFPVQRHLTLMIESRVLRLQCMCRCLYKVRQRAAESIQRRLAILNLCARKQTVANMEASLESVLTSKFEACEVINHVKEETKAPARCSFWAAGQGDPILPRKGTDAENVSQRTLTSENRASAARRKIIAREKIEFVQVSKRVATLEAPAATTPHNALATRLEGFRADRTLRREMTLSNTTPQSKVNRDKTGPVASFQERRRKIKTTETCTDMYGRTPEPLLLTSGSSAQPGGILHDLQQNMWSYHAEQHLEEIESIQRAYRNHMWRVQSRGLIRINKSEVLGRESERMTNLIKNVRDKHLQRCLHHSKYLYDAIGFEKHQSQVNNYYTQQIERLKGIYKRFWEKSDEANDDERLAALMQITVLQKLHTDILLRIKKEKRQSQSDLGKTMQKTFIFHEEK